MPTRAVSDRFVERLDKKELALLKSAMEKVTVDPTFG